MVVGKEEKKIFLMTQQWVAGRVNNFYLKNRKKNTTKAFLCMQLYDSREEELKKKYLYTI